MCYLNKFKDCRFSVTAWQYLSCDNMMLLQISLGGGNNPVSENKFSSEGLLTSQDKQDPAWTDTKTFTMWS